MSNFKQFLVGKGLRRAKREKHCGFLSVFHLEVEVSMSGRKERIH